MQNTTHTHCLRCGRTLTSTKSRAAGYGPTCARHIRRATIDTRDYKDHQIASARELIEDGGIILSRNHVLDRVLRGEANESLVAAKGGGESEKGQVVAGIAFVAGAETAIA
ncbi:DUF6011 domain-containing protein [Streptomyces sp. NPDC101149]|uniref:DUF6011 domain-containing protein n=1 Tax=Streptomyces sp. NPDC101149 TaxID=3366113 RepID=UPI003801E3B7